MESPCVRAGVDVKQQQYLRPNPIPMHRKPLELCWEGECLLYYQPQLDLQTGSLAGVEVLLRSHSPELGWIPPDRFIPIAAETGLIWPLGK